MGNASSGEPGSPGHDSDEARSTDEISRPTPGGHGPWRVVLVDDDSDLRTVTRRLLERDGRFVVVGEAGDGAEGVDVVSEQQPDVVLLDLAMPVMDGVRAIPAIRGKSPGTRVVVLTGIDDPGLHGDDVYVDADGFLEKSTAFDRLTEHLARICSA